MRLGKTVAILAVSLPVILSGCAGGDVIPGGQVTIKSRPVNAQIFVDGEMIGHTPKEINPNEVFPARWKNMTLQAEGNLTLKKQGCKTYTMKVNDSVLIQGIDVVLECSDAIAQEQVKQHAPKMAPAPMMQTIPAVAPAPAPVPQKTTETAIEQRLNKIKSLRDKGVISEQEYQQNRTRILGEL